MLHAADHATEITGGSEFNLPAASGNTIENSEIGFNTSATSPDCCGGFTPIVLFQGDTPHTTIVHNYVHDAQSQGIALIPYANASDSVDGSVISGNVVLGAVQGMTDGGAIYISGHGGNQSAHATISNNFMRDQGAGGVGGVTGVYLDDNANNVTVTGNVIGPPSKYGNSGRPDSECVEVHNGHDNTIEGNVCDLGASGGVFAVLWWQDGASIAGMANNTFTKNIVLSSFAGNQGTQGFNCNGYTFCQNSPGSDFSIGPNAYHDYAGGQVRSDGPNASDRAPELVDPQATGYLYTIASGSPVFGGAVKFPPLVGGWGPPGFVIPPSTNHSTP
jgi:hypothetical protein